MSCNAHMCYADYLCDVLCHVTWIVFNQLLYLFAINDCRPAGTYSVFQFKISTSESSEPLTNSTLTYGIITINDTCLCVLLVQWLLLFLEIRALNEEGDGIIPFLTNSNANHRFLTPSRYHLHHPVVHVHIKCNTGYCKSCYGRVVDTYDILAGLENSVEWAFISTIL